MGYDDVGTKEIDDDILIFADPYDRIDGNQDGITYFNADRFYWMWYNAVYSKQLKWRTMITVNGLKK
ncbi:MAG: hypothetical protein ABIA04_09610 [Pseudomonadota bacterium]